MSIKFKFPMGYILDCKEYINKQYESVLLKASDYYSYTHGKLDTKIISTHVQNEIITDSGFNIMH